jgi:hypothetical protein
LKTLVTVAALVGLAYIAFVGVATGTFSQGRIESIIELPGVALSKLGFSPGNPVEAVLFVGAVILGLIGLYTLLAK